MRFEGETFWMTQKAIAELFEADRSVITKHLTNIYDEGELGKETTCAEIAQVQTEGNRQVTRQVELYNLDAIIAVGYRVNSKTRKSLSARSASKTAMRLSITIGVLAPWSALGDCG